MAKKTVTKKSIIAGYQDYLLVEGVAPKSVRILTRYLKISDEDFYHFFGSLKSIETFLILLRNVEDHSLTSYPHYQQT